LVATPPSGGPDGGPQGGSNDDHREQGRHCVPDECHPNDGSQRPTGGGDPRGGNHDGYPNGAGDQPGPRPPKPRCTRRTMVKKGGKDIN